MARFETLHKPVVKLTWSVAIPRVGDSIESDMLRVKGKTWKLKLITRWDDYNKDEDWSMHLMKCDTDMSDQEKFCLTAYVGDGTEYFNMTHLGIVLADALIWSYKRRSFLSSYPRIKVTGMIDFSFEFVTLRKVSQSFVKEHKSVQTSSPIVPPSYFDDRPCLDNLSLALRKLVDEGSDSDVQLKCGECSIAAHKLILGTRSEVFRTMLQSDMLEKRKGAIEIVDMEPKVFEIFIRYLYTGILPELAEDAAMLLYEAADKYLVETLRERCGDFMAGNLTRENALRVLAMADAHSDKDLKDKVATYVLKERLPSGTYKWSEFCDDHPKLANEVLNRAYEETSLLLLQYAFRD